ncbi:hypothetical protein K525DRAFT_258552 [Schizophyllum commune Loenen D]|nr:hypothetical protein K525DRAFT_258552 [Schizophyllum commune Loenen D]
MDAFKISATPLTATEKRALLDVLNMSPATTRDYDEPFALFKQTSFDDIVSRLPAPRFSPPKPLELLDRHRASYVSREKLEDMLLLDEDTLKTLGSPASVAKDASPLSSSHLSPRLARQSTLAAAHNGAFDLPISPMRSISSDSTNLGTPFKARAMDILPSPSPSLPGSDASTLVGSFLGQFLEDTYISPIVRQQSGTPPKLRSKNQNASTTLASSSPARYEFRFSTSSKPMYFTPTRPRVTTNSASPPTTPLTNNSASKLFEMSPLTPLTSPDTSPEAPLSRVVRRLPMKKNNKQIMPVSPTSLPPGPSTPAKRSMPPPQGGRRKMRRLRNSSPMMPASDDNQGDSYEGAASAPLVRSSNRHRLDYPTRAAASSRAASVTTALRSSSPARAPAASSPSPEPDSPIIYTYRDLPAYVERRPDLMEAVYRRFPASSYYQPPESDIKSPYELFSRRPINGMYNAPRDPWDLYTPRFVRGCGPSKVGACPICIEPRERGGRGKKVWLAMKFSAYNYHMQYAHGISATTTRPFSPPVRFRQVRRERIAKGERVMMMEGLCHQCKKWVAVEGVKDVEVKVKELFWWKHAATCHHGKHIDGDRDFWEDDEVHRKLTAMDACSE